MSVNLKTVPPEKEMFMMTSPQKPMMQPMIFGSVSFS